jgi:predicted dehydrogenase
MARSSEPALKELTVAIIGAGQIGQRHVQSFAGLGASVRVIGVADVDEDRATELAAACGACAFVDYHALLDLGPDIAVICLPHHLHRDAGLAAAEARCHVLMEKPLAHTLEDAYAIVDGCQKHNVRLAVSFVHRYRAEFQQAHDLITRGDIGEPAMALDVFGLPGGPNVPSWVWEKQYGGGGILMYSGIHSVDWQSWLLGSSIEEVSARSISVGEGTDVETGLSATLIFANGCLGSLIGNQPGYLVTPRTRSTEVYGTAARLKIRSGEFLKFTSDDQDFCIAVNRDDPFVAQARELVAAVREQREPWITGEDGLRAQEAVEAIYRSAELRRPVYVKDISG